MAGDSQPMELSESCQICLTYIDNPINLCEDNHERFCTSCMSSYIQSTVSNSYMGSCPIICCPSEVHVKKKEKKIIKYEKWKEIVPMETSQRFTLLANSLLAFLCGGCHTLKSLDIGYDPKNQEIIPSIQEAIQIKGKNRSSFEYIKEMINQFISGNCGLDEFYRNLKQVCPSMTSGGDTESWKIFSAILRLISDPERRANLHLRYLRERPRIRTLCCRKEHCFSCKIKDFHEGKTCIEHLCTLDHSIVNCPACGISIAKGDGCNTIICVCGKQFSWSIEKEITERCHLFLENYSVDTHNKCAEVLCSGLTGVELQRAKAWHSRHQIEVNKSLLEWYKEKYSPCPSQSCVILQKQTLSEGVKEAISLWKQTHSKEVEHRKQQHEFSIKSMFLSLCSNEKEYPLVAHRIITMSRKGQGLKLTNKSSMNQPSDYQLVTSAFKWIEENREIYNKTIEELEERSTQQFLLLYGNKVIKSIKLMQLLCPSSLEWCRITSNPDLTFSNNNMTVERCGSVSCYPAAFCNLISERAMFRVVIDAAPRSSNWLTFGVAKKGMPTSSSDGVGRTQQTWGISDDRSSSSNSIVASSGLEVGTFRKLQVGDILMAVIDIIDGWCEISVNEVEFVHRFLIPHGTIEEYCFAMTFANDHRVTILTDQIDPSQRIKLCELRHNSELNPKKNDDIPACDLNPEHILMLSHFKKYLKNIIKTADNNDDDFMPSIIVADTSNTFNYNSTSSGFNQSFSSSSSKDRVTNLFICKKCNKNNFENYLETNGNEWIKLFDNDKAVAQDKYEKIREEIEIFLSLKKNITENNTIIPFNLETALIGNMTWKNLYFAICWYSLNKKKFEKDREIEKANKFIEMHGADASFMAAMTLADPAFLLVNSRRLNGGFEKNLNLKPEQENALAYMKHNPEIMNEWYEYDKNQSDPMIENVCKDCQCLPRHIRHCPNKKK